MEVIMGTTFFDIKLLLLEIEMKLFVS